jgi:Tfp pilus assembly protein PilZ
MLPTFGDGRPFARGGVDYNNVPEYELSEHMVLMVEIGDYPKTMMTEAVVYTGVPYMICTREMAKAVGLNLSKPEETGRVRVEGVWVEGGIYSVTLTLLADVDKGESVPVVVWAFVPNREEDFNPDPLPPTFLGLKGCLNSFLFAVDPFSQTFYFG